MKKKQAMENTDPEVRNPRKPTMSLGETLDKLTILTRKIAFGDTEAISEHRHLEKALYAWGLNGKIITNTIRLAYMNFEIWNLENSIRRGDVGEFELDEIGEKALKIRDFNKKRIEYKNNLNMIDKGFRESKVNHRSA